MYVRRQEHSNHMRGHTFSVWEGSYDSMNKFNYACNIHSNATYDVCRYVIFRTVYNVNTEESASIMHGCIIHYSYTAQRELQLIDVITRTVAISSSDSSSVFSHVPAMFRMCGDDTCHQSVFRRRGEVDIRFVHGKRIRFMKSQFLSRLNRPH